MRKRDGRVRREEGSAEETEERGERALILARGGECHEQLIDPLYGKTEAGEEIGTHPSKDLEGWKLKTKTRPARS